MNVFVHILRALWAMHSQRFWLMWFTITTASLIYVMSVIGQVETPRSQTRKHPIGLILTWRQIETPRAVVALMLLALFLAFYIAMNLVWEDFAHHDDDLFMLYTLKGYNYYPLSIWRDNGRFFPFSTQELNLIRHFTNTPFCQIRDRFEGIAATCWIAPARA